MNVKHIQVIIEDMAMNAMHTQADIVINIEVMATNAMHTQADMVVLSLKIW